MQHEINTASSLHFPLVYMLFGPVGKKLTPLNDLK